MKQDLFEDFYNSGVVNLVTNSTFIRLILKRNEPARLSDIRYISLVTSLYMIIAKVISLRHMEVLGETVSTAQGAFVRD